MRILYLTPFLPEPAASHGGGSYLSALADGMKEQANLGLVHIRHLGETLHPNPTFSWQRSANYRGAPNGPSHQLRMLWRWRNQPLLAAKYWQPDLHQHLLHAIRDFQPDVALVELAQMAQYLPSLSGIPTVFTDHEAGQPANASTGMGRQADRRDNRLWLRYIRKYYRQANLIQALTQEDAAALSEIVDREVLVRPPTLNIPPTACEPGKAPPRALFLGDYRHGPNPDAAKILATEVWPLVRAACPNAELLLAGPNEHLIRELDQLPGVKILGFVPDLMELLGRVRLVLAPLWSGRGFRVKNATALSFGVPVVTNELGSRGCRAPDPACIIAENVQDLAKAALRHLESAEFASAAGELARDWACANYAPVAVARLQLDRAEQLLQ